MPVSHFGFRPVAVTMTTWALGILLSLSAASGQVNLVIKPSSGVHPLGPFPSNSIGNTTTFAPGFGVSAAQAWTVLTPPPDNKHESYIPALTLFPTGAPTIDQIASITYWTNKPTTSADVDWTFYMYTVKTGAGDSGSFYHSRLNSEPYFTATPPASAPPNQWHQWGTNAANPMRFYDANRNGGIFGTFTDPTLAQIQAGTITWPVTNNMTDYGPEVVSIFSFQTGTAWAAAFRGLLDGVTITLNDGRFATINFEADLATDVYQIRYFSNLTLGGSVINFTNNGAASTAANLPSGAQNGNICANLYAYSADEQLASCCSCMVTPNGLASVLVREDLGSNVLTPVIPSALVVKIIATVAPDSGVCNPAVVGAIPGTNGLTSGLHAWGSTLHPLPVTSGTPATTYGVAETRFARAALSDTELTRMTQMCAFIRANGSGFGICKSCQQGGLGARVR